MARKKKDNVEKSAVQLAKEKQAQLEESGFNRIFKGGANPDTLVPDKSKGSEREQIEFDETFDILVACAILSKVVAALKKMLQNVFITKTVFDHFKEVMLDTKSKPESFDAVSVTGKAKAQWQYAKKAFSPEIAEILETYGCRFEKEEKIASGWFLNPEIAANDALIRKLAGLIESSPDFKNIDVFLPQKGKTVYKLNDTHTINDVVSKVPAEYHAAVLKDIGSIKLAQTYFGGQKVLGGKKVDPVAAAQANSGLFKKCFDFLSNSNRLNELVLDLANSGESGDDDE